MQVIVISESLVIRKGIMDLLKNEEYINNIHDTHIYKEIFNKEYDLVIIETKRNSQQFLNEIKKFKTSKNTQILVLDFNENRDIFSKCMKIGIEGYILANINAENIPYDVNQINKGKKYYDPELIESFIENNCLGRGNILTSREKEILIEIVSGKTNSQIASTLFITQHTVKKHTSKIFSKLQVKDRIQAALYAQEYGLVSF